MKVEIVPLPATQVVESAIVVDGVQIGTVKPAEHSEVYKYHVILASKDIWSIYQGFGMTIDAAMRDAITTGRARRRMEITELDELENAIWGDHELHK